MDGFIAIAICVASLSASMGLAGVIRSQTAPELFIGVFLMGMGVAVVVILSVHTICDAIRDGNEDEDEELEKEASTAAV